MRVKITKKSGFTNPPEWYDGQIGSEFDVLYIDDKTVRVDLPYDLYMNLGQFQYYVPRSCCEIV
jgi:hypothetical protein